MNDQEAFDSLKNGDKTALEWVFKTYRKRFVYWAMGNYHINMDDATTLFVDTLVVLERNARTKPQMTLDSSLLTYLIGIAKIIKLNEKPVPITTPDIPTMGEEDKIWIEDNTQLMVKLALKELEAMGHPCNQLVTLFYLGEKKLEEIVEIMMYNNKDVVKSQKVKCLKELTTRILNKLPHILNEMNESCRNILTLYFIEKRTLEQIRVIVGYDTKEQVLERKDACLKDLLKRLL